MATTARLANAGVDIDHVCWPGMIHGFASMAGVVDAGRSLIDRVGRKLRATARP